MARLDAIKDSIREIAGRPKNVTLSEIEKVLQDLTHHGYVVTTRANDHAKMFSVGEYQFSICTHHRGSRQIKSCYVREFLKIMNELELYD
jgi:hypothetical protein